ncbi:sulfite exporter TauE/SafE [Clostridium magnum DSM 2767]|uniref:Probable membrane transporter protein n=2 Tax=Clostridium magnum TaxID=33954 RepID=A0A162S2S2_9CLOT|nr:sulfite exporter TauE/SafE [Clostridium magnum DSM 2767]SHI41002.1 Sulfite exporter TauE/SafE [Clostridium magnum DSM 2767]
MTLGSISGSYIGAHFSKRITENSLKKVILTLLVAIGLLLIIEGLHPITSSDRQYNLSILFLILAITPGLGIGFISSLLGVANNVHIITQLASI